MMHFRFIPIVRWDKQDPLLSSSANYIERIKRYRPCDTHPIKPSNPAQEKKQVKKLMKSSDSGPFVVLDEHGTQLSTNKLTSKIERWEQDGNRSICFLVGGAYGVDSEIKKSATFLWSLGQLTLPHKIAFTIVCEQVYRVQTIIRNEPYHHG